MTTFAAVLAAMLSLPVASFDRHDSVADRLALYTPIAEAIAEVARNDEEAAWLTAQAYHESGLARYVLEGRCMDGPVGARCDNGLSRGPWQLRKWCRATTLAGEAACALSLARGGRQHCTNGWLGAFAATRGMASCSWSQSPKRVRTMRIVLERIRKARAEAHR